MSNLIKTVLSVFFCLTFANSLPAESWTPKESLQMKAIKEVCLAPDNSSAIFVVSTANLEKNVFTTQLYKADLKDRSTPFLFTETESSAILPKWSPDGSWIAFISDRAGSQNLYLIRPNGGEATLLFKTTKNIQTFKWSPDSQSIAFVMPDDSKDSSGAILYDEELPMNRLWVVEIKKPTDLRPLTPATLFMRGRGDFANINAEFDWSPDGKAITFAYSPNPGFDNFYMDSSIATVELATGNIVHWEKKAQHESLPRYSPNGQWIAYLSSDTPTSYALNKQIALRKPDGTNFKLLAKTFNEGPFFALPTLLEWNSQNDQLLFQEPKATKFALSWVPIDGTAPIDIPTREWFFQIPTLSEDKTLIAFVGQSPENPPEVYITNLNPFTPHAISNTNSHFESFPKPHTEVIQWNSNDGQKIEGLVTYPLNYQKGKKYPLLLVIHGGPMAYFNESFLGIPSSYPLAAFAEAGFAILRPNPRGSCGYGKAFRCSNYGDWGGKDYQDLMSGVDHLIDTGLADPEKLGVMGWSYGGYMTSWIVTQTPRFKAASIGAGLCNLISMNGTTDLHRFMEDYLGHFSKNIDLYLARSPLFFAEKVTTPCLIQHGTDDQRVPVTQAKEFYYALNHNRKIATLVLYPRTGHAITEPNLIIDAGQRNLDWFKKYLLTN